MSDNRKKSRRRRSNDDTAELTPIEKSIAKHLRFQCPTKERNANGYRKSFISLEQKQLNVLTESKWSSITAKALGGQSPKESKHPVCFSSKHDAVQV